jgi:hypothetical protein
MEVDRKLNQDDRMRRQGRNMPAAFLEDEMNEYSADEMI